MNTVYGLSGSAYECEATDDWSLKQELGVRLGVAPFRLHLEQADGQRLVLVQSHHSEHAEELCLAAHAGDLATVQRLLESCADPSEAAEMEDEEEVPLDLALRSGHLAVARLLLEAWADLESRAEGTALLKACEGHLDVTLLLENRAKLEATDQRGRTALCLAAGSGHLQATRELLDALADVNGADDEGNTALWWACDGEHREVIRQLLEHRGDANAEGARGERPLHLAATHGNLEIVELLVEAQAEVNARNEYQESALWLASRHASLEVLKALLAMGADPEQEDENQARHLDHLKSAKPQERVVNLPLPLLDVSCLKEMYLARRSRSSSVAPSLATCPC